MATIPKPIYGNAGNGSATTLYTVAAGETAIVETVSAYNSTAGALTLTITITEEDGTTSTVAVASISAGATAQFAKGSSTPAFPQALLAGAKLNFQGSGSGISIRASALRYT